MKETGSKNTTSLKYEELEKSEEFSFGALGVTTVISSALVAGVMILVHLL